MPAPQGAVGHLPRRQSDDYKTRSVAGAKGGISGHALGKGPREELETVAQAVAGGQPAVPLWQTLQAMEIAFAVETKLVESDR